MRERRGKEERVRGGLQERGMTPLFSLGSSHVKEVRDSFFYHFFREVKERDTLAVDSRGEPIDLNVFL